MTIKIQWKSGFDLIHLSVIELQYIFYMSQQHCCHVICKNLVAIT